MNMQEQAPKTVRIPGDLCDRIDAVRGLVPREAWIRQMLERAVGIVEDELAVGIVEEGPA